MEIWKDIEGYEGLYQVSNEGRVKSLNYRHTGEEQMLKPANNGWGYLQVNLWKNSKHKMYRVHRLVANAFLPNPDKLPQVNHKDECKTNNCVENLEYCTAKYNVNYGTYKARISETMTNGKLSIPVDMFSNQGVFIRQFPSVSEAMRWLQTNASPKASVSHITQCCKNQRNTAYGFKWQYSKKELS